MTGLTSFYPARQPDPACPDLRQQMSAAAIAAAYDRLNIAPVWRAHLSELKSNEVEIVLASLRRLIARRCRKGRSL